VTARTFVRRALAKSLACALVALPAAAAPATDESLSDMSLERLLEMPVQLVYSASKYEQKVTRAPASVSIVTAEEIHRYGYRTLGDVLGSMHGVYVWNDRNYSYMGVRGFLRPGDYNSRVLTLINGHRSNDNLYSGGLIGHEAQVDIDDIERVEFVRGPSSSIYGSSAFFGVVNIITKRPEQAQGLEVSGGLGSYDAYESRVSYGKRYQDKTGVMLSASHYSADGANNLYYRPFDPAVSDDPRAANGGLAHALDDEEAFNLQGTLERGDFTLSAYYMSRDKQVPTASYGTLFNDPGLRTNDRHGMVDLKYQRQLAADLTMLARAGFDRYEYTGSYPLDLADEGEPLFRAFSIDQARGEWVSLDWQLTGKLRERDSWIAGVEYRENLHQKQYTFDDIDPRVVYIDSDERNSELGLYAQGELSLTNRWLINAGLRYDHYYNGFGGTLSPRAGLIFNPREQSSVKALYGRAFRAPSAFERFYYLGVFERPQLDPEKIRTYELIYEETLSRHHRLSVSAYHYRIQDLISQAVDIDGQPYYANLDCAHATGAEIEGEGMYDNGVQARVSYTRQRTHDCLANRDLVSSPHHLAKASALAPVLGERLSAGAELQFQSRSRTLTNDYAASFWTANLVFSSRFSQQRLEITGGIYNAFDRQYGYPGAGEHLQDVIEQDGRTYRVRLIKNFGRD
jgi:outer membrane receptor for ferrienterochelin and colicins